jgi:hypothetical protein
MKTKTLASIAFILALAFSVSLCLCGEKAYAQTSGVATIIHNGSALPSGAANFSEFILTTGTPTLYICNNSPSCTSSGQWVTSSGSTGYVNVALSNISGTAVDAGIYAGSGVTLTLGGFVGTSGANPTGVLVIGGNAYTGTSQTPGGVTFEPGTTAAVGATPANINFTGQAGFGTTGLGSNIYFTAGAGGSTSPLNAGLISFGAGGAAVVTSESSPLTGSFVPSIYSKVGAGSYNGEVDYVNGGSGNGVIRVTGMNFAFYADNTYDFDLAAYRPRSLYLGTGLYLGSTAVGFTGETSSVSGNLMAAGTVAGSSVLLCTDAAGHLTQTTSGCPPVPTTATLVSGNYVSASGAAAVQDSTVNAGPYLGSTLPWETVANCSGTALGTITSANTGYIFGLTLEFPEKTTKLEYDVVNADNTANTYDVALFLGVPSSTNNRVLHIGASSSTGLAGTTFAPANGWRGANWFEGATTLQPGRYYLMFTSNCTLGGTSCAEIQANAISTMFYWPGSGGVSIAAGGASPSTYTSSADSPSSSTVPCLFIE